MEKDPEKGTNGTQPSSSSSLRDAVVAPLAGSCDDGSNQLSLRAVEPVDIRVRNLTLHLDVSPGGFGALTSVIKKRKRGTQGEPQIKTILSDVSANMPSGSLTGIFGGSGSGKTSMLNIMSHRMSGARLKGSGSTLYNGLSKLSSIRSAYVMQQDVLLPTLTVRETLQYAADLRLAPPTSAEERRLVVEEVILELGLKECANTRIGDSEHKGCSGGEKVLLLESVCNVFIHSFYREERASGYNC